MVWRLTDNNSNFVMSVSESIFLFEITIDELKIFDERRFFCIQSKFSDIFKLNLKNPNVKNKQRNKIETKSKLGKGMKVQDHFQLITQVQNCQSVSFTANILNLYNLMKTHPLEILLWNKYCPSHLIGSTQVQWNRKHLDYLIATYDGLETEPVSIFEDCSIYNKDIMKLIVTLKLRMRLTHIQKGITKQLDVMTPKENGKFLQDNGLIKTNTHKHSRHDSYNVKTVDNATNVLNNKKQISSETSVNNKSCIDPATNKTKSLSSIHKQYLLSDYIYCNSDRNIPKQIYYVGYMTSIVTKKETNSPKENQGLLTVPCTGKCLEYPCESNKGTIPIPDQRYLIDYTNFAKECCSGSTGTKVEEVVGKMKAKLVMGMKPCDCTCECFFDLAKTTTTYNEINRNVRKVSSKASNVGITKEQKKSVDSHGTKQNDELTNKPKETVNSLKKPQLPKTIKKTNIEAPNPEKETNSKKSKKKKHKIIATRTTEKNIYYGCYGYSAPHIGHSQCGLTGSPVPKDMGWLWTADDIPGLEYRPKWKPGAAPKKVVKMLNAARNKEDGSSKKRKKVEEDVTKKTKCIPRPLLLVHQKDGEYEVRMETMKKFSKQRGFNQFPYEDKPPLIYTVGRTKEENLRRERKREREKRRFERDARNFIQSSFKNMCKQICGKTCQDALELLPSAEDPKCQCFVPEANQDDNSCSCSEDENLSKYGSDTDSDEWLLEFTPPVAKYLPDFNRKKIQKVDKESQYTYLDYRVKLIDSLGNEVPRFFKGPDGQTKCSDLGGFWGSGNKWLKINHDGIIGPDGKWAPMSFIGPDHERVDISDGKFQTNKGDWMVVGVDGYVDNKGIWRYYPRIKRNESQMKKRLTRISQQQPLTKAADRTKAGGDKLVNHLKKKPKRNTLTKQVDNADANFSCFGDASPQELTNMGITGHGNDKKLLMRTLSQMLAQGVRFANAKSFVPRAPRNARVRQPDTRSYFNERGKCHHSVPSDKGIVAVDDLGNKTYFTLKSSTNWRPGERLQNLEDQGIRLSSFHVPCLNSFVGSELMKQQLRTRLFELYGNDTETLSPE